MSYGRKDEQIFLGREMAVTKNFSEATAVEIDEEIRRIVEDNYKRARTLLTDNIELLHKLSQALIDKESLNGTEVDEIIGRPAAAPETSAFSWESPAE